MSLVPEIKIMANGDDEFTTAHVGRKLVAVRWRSADRFHVAAPGSEPQVFDDEGDAVRAFLGAAVGTTRV